MEKSAENLLEQYEKFKSILSKVVSESNVEKLDELFGEKILFCPRGTKLEDGGFPGALVEFSLRVASEAKSLAGKFNQPVKSAVKVSLLHELGKIGNLDQDFYIQQDSDWHREKLGQTYKYNDLCSRVSISHRSVWIANQSGIVLTEDELVAILTGQGLHLDENSFYSRGNSLCPLSSCLQASRTISLL